MIYRLVPRRFQDKKMSLHNSDQRQPEDPWFIREKIVISKEDLYVAIGLYGVLFLILLAIFISALVYVIKLRRASLKVPDLQLDNDDVCHQESSIVVDMSKFDPATSINLNF